MVQRSDVGFPPLVSFYTWAGVTFPRLHAQWDSKQAGEAVRRESSHRDTPEGRQDQHCSMSIALHQRPASVPSWAPLALLVLLVWLLLKAPRKLRLQHISGPTLVARVAFWCLFLGAPWINIYMWQPFVLIAWAEIKVFFCPYRKGRKWGRFLWAYQSPASLGR